MIFTTTARKMVGSLFCKPALSLLLIAGLTAGPLMAEEPPPPEAQTRLQGEMMRFEMFRGYLKIIERFGKLSRDPTTCGIAAVLRASDIAKTKSTQAAVDFLVEALKDVKNDAVQRAIRFQLAEIYRTSGQTDKALEQLQSVITSTPASTTPEK